MVLPYKLLNVWPDDNYKLNKKNKLDYIIINLAEPTQSHSKSHIKVGAVNNFFLEIHKETTHGYQNLSSGSNASTSSRYMNQPTQELELPDPKLYLNFDPSTTKEPDKKRRFPKVWL